MVRTDSTYKAAGCLLGPLDDLIVTAVGSAPMVGVEKSTEGVSTLIINISISFALMNIQNVRNQHREGQVHLRNHRQPS